MPKLNWAAIITCTIGIILSITFWVFFISFLSCIFFEKAEAEEYQPWGNPINPPTISDYYPPSSSSSRNQDLGFIVHFNNLDHPNDDKEQFWAVPTPFGEFVFQVFVTPNGECEIPCPDRVELYHAPDGYTVYPFSAETPEYGATIMHIHKILGV